MIKIDTKQFDMKTIESIYDNLVIKIWNNYSKCTNPDIKRLFQQHFIEISALCSDKEEKSFKEKMNAYLLTDSLEDIKKMIEAFSFAKCKEQLSTKMTKKVYHGQLKAILSYGLISKDIRHKLVCAMNVSVCPYCNRQYITNYRGPGKRARNATGDLDHFYMKDEYPIAALCLYNLVPSCQICNSRFKIVKDFLKTEHIHPYMEGFDNQANFRIMDEKGSEKVLLDDFHKKQNEYRIELNKDGDLLEEKYANSINDLKLNEVYNSHDKYVKELVNKITSYSESQIEEYLKGFPELFSSREDILEFLFGQAIYPKEHSEIPLGKLTYDILKQYGIID